MKDVLTKVRTKVSNDREDVADNLTHLMEEVGELSGKIRRGKEKIDEAADVVYEALKLYIRLGGSDTNLEFLLLQRATKDKGRL